MLGKRARIHHAGTALGEDSFIHRRILLVKFVREDELQHGVAEKFQALVVLKAGATFVRDGRMREREAQQALVLEPVGQLFLQRSEVGHGGKISCWPASLQRTIRTAWRQQFQQ